MRSRPNGCAQLRLAAVVAAAAVIAGACSSDATSTTTSVTTASSTTTPTVPAPSAVAPTGPDDTIAPPPDPATASRPDEMCADGQVPQAIAYDIDDGNVRWVSCTEDMAYRVVHSVTDEAVFLLDLTAQPKLIALDPADGSVLTDPPAQPPLPTGPQNVDQTVDGLTVHASQPGPVVVTNADGTTRWSQPGSQVYGDVLAVDDGAVFALVSDGPGSTRLVAYDIDTGDIQWEYAGGESHAEGLWPWYAADGRLYTLWQNLQVRDTSSGELLWKTDYAAPRLPLLRLAGAAADDDTVYVGVGTAAAGGD